MKHDGETTHSAAFREGFLVGVLVGEGHFGGDAKQPHVTLRMHVKHQSIFTWLIESFPGGKLYGPYEHGGRCYYQWMARGRFLREVLLPILDRRLTPNLDQTAFSRYEEMKRRYGLEPPEVSSSGAGEDPSDQGRTRE